ncbi:hypothetical protein [Amycolatopsis sp. cmx-4-54]|uniref:hypothetical protein n=1 Tax=Amycolatopsis sp. cmx-4-54 TaxID=2790936 RepID=UPI00397A033A
MSAAGRTLAFFSFCSALPLGFNATAERAGIGAMFGSTDMGNVSLCVPVIHPMLSFDLPPEDGNHTAAFAVAAGGPEGDRFVRDAGLAMAFTVAAVARSGEIRARLIARARDSARITHSTSGVYS